MQDAHSHGAEVAEDFQGLKVYEWGVFLIPCLCTVEQHCNLKSRKHITFLGQLSLWCLPGSSQLLRDCLDLPPPVSTSLLLNDPLTTEGLVFSCTARSCVLSISVTRFGLT